MATATLYRSIFEVLIVLSTLASGLVLWRSTQSMGDETRTSSSPRSRSTSSLLRHPLTLFAIICLLIFANQIAFNAYVLRVHGGDVSFVGQYLPRGWFVLSRGPVVRWVAAHVGDGHVLAPSVLNVQAFLELPFVITAYLSVARLLGGRVYWALTRLPVLLIASASFTITFSLVELSVPNPWTSSDIAIRAIAGVLVPLAMAWIARRDRGDARRPVGALGLLAFLIGAAAMAYIVLAVYDAFLLYNLGHMGGYVPGLAISIALLVATSWGIPHLSRDLRDVRDGRDEDTSHVATCARDALATFTVVFFVPSLVLRYQGYRPIAFACGILLIMFAFIFGLRRALKRFDATFGDVARLVCSAGVGLAVGIGAVLVLALRLIDFVDSPGLRDNAPEGDLALVVSAFLATTIASARFVELILGGRGRDGAATSLSP